MFGLNFASCYPSVNLLGSSVSLNQARVLGFKIDYLRQHLYI